MSTEEKPQRLSPLLRRFLILKLWLVEKFQFGERQVLLGWAAVIGILAALVTECFRRATDLLHFLLTGSEATIITSFERRFMYGESLERKGAAFFKRQLVEVDLVDLIKRDPLTLPQNATFAQIAQTFVEHQFQHIYIVDGQRKLLGAVSLHQVSSDELISGLRNGTLDLAIMAQPIGEQAGVEFELLRT
jgi:CBS domain-containing protein